MRRWGADWRRSLPDLGLLVSTGVVAALAGLPHVLGSLGTASAAGFDFPEKLHTGAALGQLLFLSHAKEYSQWWSVLLLRIGVVTLRRRRYLGWWLVGGGFAGLFVLAASYGTELAQVVTRPWWNDRWRLAAIVTLVLITVAASGHVTIMVALLVVFGLLSNGFYVPANAERMAETQGNGPTVSRSDRIAMHRLAGSHRPGPA